MIAKAARIINQLNEHVEELQKIENPALTKKKAQLLAINNSIKHLEFEGLPVPKALVQLHEKHESEKKRFDDPEEILEFIRDQLKLTIKKIDRTDSNETQKGEKRKISKNMSRSNKNKSITKKEWIEISQAEKKRYNMEYNEGIITLIDIFGETHRCKSIKALKRHERGEGHKREKV